MLRFNAFCVQLADSGVTVHKHCAVPRCARRAREPSQTLFQHARGRQQRGHTANAIFFCQSVGIDSHAKITFSALQTQLHADAHPLGGLGCHDPTLLSKQQKCDSPGVSDSVSLVSRFSQAGEFYGSVTAPCTGNVGYHLSAD